MNESLRIFCRTQLMIEEEERIGQLEQREQSMRQLESDIVDVNTIFKVMDIRIFQLMLENSSKCFLSGSCNNGARTRRNCGQHRTKY